MKSCKGHTVLNCKWAMGFCNQGVSDVSNNSDHFGALGETVLHSWLMFFASIITIWSVKLTFNF